jgi:CcmD family protein
VKSYSFLFWAYNVIWLGIAIYLLFVFLRVRHVDRRLENLSRELERRAEQDA